MTLNPMWRELGENIIGGISACSSELGESSPAALSKIAAGAEMLKTLLPHEPREQRDKLGEYLSLAVTEGKPDAVAKLLSLSANIEFRAHGVTSLHQSAALDRTDIIDMLLRAGADINARVGSGPHPPGSAIHIAVRGKYPQALRVLVAAGANINEIDHVRSQDTPLHLAAALKPSSKTPLQSDEFVAAELVTILIEGGADVNRKNREKDIPLLTSVYFNNMAAFDVLLNADQYPDNDLRRASEIAAQRNRTHVIKTLMSVRPDVIDVDRLIECSKKVADEAMRKLLDSIKTKTYVEEARDTSATDAQLGATHLDAEPL
jgi:ankyrin repeat protein